jgi:hypothetical protein
VETWLDDSRDVTASANISSKNFVVKNPEICGLPNYEKSPPPNFWKNFPSYYPKKAVSSVKVTELENLIAVCWDSWTLAQKKNGKENYQKVERQAAC